MAPLEVGFHPGYERKGIFTVDTVLSQLGNSWAVFDGDPVPVISLRYQVFARSRACVGCGIVGTYFAKERSARRIKNRKDGDEFFFRATTATWHFNLYAMTADGREILMTKDHINPRSKGGVDNLENLQTMCRPCNNRKDDHRHYQTVFPFEGIVTK
jgi:hypothetical protein